MFLKKIIPAAIDGVEKSLFLGKDNVGIIKAKLICKNFGMRLLEPETEAEEAVMKNALKNEKEREIPQRFFIGLSSKGSDDAYYSISSGKVLSFDLKDEFDNPSADKTKECLTLYQHSSDPADYIYSVIDCRVTGKFICEKSAAENKLTD